MAVPLERPDLGISDSKQSKRSTAGDSLGVSEELAVERPGQPTTLTD